MNKNQSKHKKSSPAGVLIALMVMSVIVLNPTFISETLKSGSEQLVQLTQTQTPETFGPAPPAAAVQGQQMNHSVIRFRAVPVVFASSTERTPSALVTQMAMQAQELDDEQAQALLAENNVMASKVAQLARQSRLLEEKQNDEL